MRSIEQIIAEEIGCQERQVHAAVGLLDDGATVPFIARYRKEVTDGLDDTQLRNLEERLRYLREMEERREAILKSIAEQEKLTPELEKAIQEADTKTRLEDLYLPFKQKRRTKGQIALEAGLGELAEDGYWQITVAYFKPSSTSAEPEYEIQFSMQANGLVREYEINYGDFSIMANLKSVEPVESVSCS